LKNSARRKRQSVYSSMAVFRQRRRGLWDDVIADIREKLASLIS
jgi:hypothetical protein